MALDFSKVLTNPSPIIPNPWKWLAPKNAGDTGGPNSLPDGLHGTCPTLRDNAPAETIIAFAPVVRAAGQPYNTLFIEQAVTGTPVTFMSQGTNWTFVTQSAIDDLVAVETDLQFTLNGTVFDAGIQWLLHSQQVRVFDYSLGAWQPGVSVGFTPTTSPSYVSYEFMTEIALTSTHLTYTAIWIAGVRHTLGYTTIGVPNVYPGATALNIGLQLDGDNTGRTASVVAETACVVR
jgi:hypothetical protein